MRKVHVVITTGGTSGAYGEALAAGTVDSIPGGSHYPSVGSLDARVALSSRVPGYSWPSLLDPWVKPVVGLPIFVDGEFVGAMAASGARGSEDAQAVRAGLAMQSASRRRGDVHPQPSRGRVFGSWQRRYFPAFD